MTVSLEHENAFKHECNQYQIINMYSEKIGPWVLSSFTEHLHKTWSMLNQPVTMTIKTKVVQSNPGKRVGKGSRGR